PDIESRCVKAHPPSSASTRPNEAARRRKQSPPWAPRETGASAHRLPGKSTPPIRAPHAISRSATFPGPAPRLLHGHRLATPETVLPRTAEQSLARAAPEEASQAAFRTRSLPAV